MQRDRDAEPVQENVDHRAAPDIRGERKVADVKLLRLRCGAMCIVASRSRHDEDA
jgi:hypothetical protein